jgi:hypothetical protein
MDEVYILYQIRILTQQMLFGPDLQVNINIVRKCQQKTEQFIANLTKSITFAEKSKYCFKPCHI